MAGTGTMASPDEWVVTLSLGVLFTGFGALKLYGFCKGYEGGPGRSRWERLRAGRCAPEHCRLPRRVQTPFYLVVWVLLLGCGLCSLGRFLAVVSTR